MWLAAISKASKGQFGRGRLQASYGALWADCAEYVPEQTKLVIAVQVGACSGAVCKPVGLTSE